MRRENHRRRGMSRASSGGWGHRAVYVGAAVATAALLAGFGAAVLIYGPLGSPSRTLAGSTLNVAPTGVTFGNASITYASGLNLINATGSEFSWNGSGGAPVGPCNQSGIDVNLSGSYVYSNNASGAVGLYGNTTLVCLNSVDEGALNATWYWGTANNTNASNEGKFLINNTYTAGGIPNGSFFNNGFVNISSCSNWSMYHNINTTTYNGSYIPCETYFQMDNGTTWLPSFSGNNSTLWAPNQSGYAPYDLVYAIPIVFGPTARVGTYSLSVAIGGVTPVAQTFYFNETANPAAPGLGENNTVLFTFDMTAAYLLDLSVTNITPFNASSFPIYASVGVVSSIVSECGTNATGQAVCPVVTKL